MSSLRLCSYLVAVICGVILMSSLRATAAPQDDNAPKLEQKAAQSPGPMMRCGQDEMMCQARPRCARCPIPCAVRVLLVLLVICHIILASWIYTDIRKRGEGHGIFIILTLLAGFPAAVVYALVRIGDRKT
jgi:hypothetical protein